MLDTTECSRCRKHPQLMWAWDGINKVQIIEETAVAASIFADRAVAHLEAAGWQMIGDEVCCPDCAAVGTLTN